MDLETGYSNRIVFKIKDGHTFEDTIILIGQAKGVTLRGRIRQLYRMGEPIPNLVELCQVSRKQLRGGILN